MERTKVFITVVTYPHPSTKYREIVCTAGLTKTGEWVRLYPINHRDLPQYQKFRKFQWIEVGLDAQGSGNDSRRESRRPDVNSIRICGLPLRPESRWKERRKIIDSLPHHTLNQLMDLYKKDKTSLGIVRPTRVIDIEIEDDSTDWDPKYQATFDQLNLFAEDDRKLTLRKIPYKFSYVFECEDTDKPHRAKITDWELGVLWLKEAKRLGEDGKAAESVRDKFLKELCSPVKDTRFFMGTVFPYNSWIVVGVFWPPKEDASQLEFALN